MDQMCDANMIFIIIGKKSFLTLFFLNLRGLIFFFNYEIIYELVTEKNFHVQFWGQKN